ncbi:MAG TPA: ABC transporter substrate binding protein [Desulfuromonadaceae bacterium]
MKGVHRPVKLPAARLAAALSDALSGRSAARRSCAFLVMVLALLSLSLPATYAGDATVIAAVMSSDQPRYREAHRAFVKSLAARGYAAPAIEISLTCPNQDSPSLSSAIRKITSTHPDLIVAYGSSASQVVTKEAEGVPIVSVDTFAADPPPSGTSGVSSRVPMITLLKTLQDIGPYRRIGVILSARDIGSQRQLEDIRKCAVQLGLSVVEGNVTSVASVDNVLTTLLDRVDVIVAATESPAVFKQFDRIIARAKSRKVPVVATMPKSAERGALVSLEIHPQEQGHLAAEIATRILEGARAEHLSLLTPRQIDLVLNVRVARELGISMPNSVVSAATRIVK